MNGFSKTLFGALIVLGVAASDVSAAPWIEVGDASARRDVELLHAHGIVSGPVNSWPMPWAQVIGSLDGANDKGLPHLRAAIERLKRKYERDVLAPSRDWRFTAEVGATNSPQLIRGFESPPRDRGEAKIGAERVYDNVAVRLNVGAESDLEDDSDIIFDGSYAAYTWGNVLFHAGFTEQWWGPGRDGAIQLTNNSRPFPVVGISRLEPLPFESPYLSWIGPWRLSGFLGVLDDDRPVENPFFAGMRAEVEPIDGLSIGLSRTIQFCGDGVDCGAGDILDAVVGSDNNRLLGSTGTGNSGSDQKAGVDLRYATSLGAYDVEGYLEIAGEDQAGFLPSKLASLAGVGVGGPVGAQGGRFHVYAEVADTEANDGIALFFGRSDQRNVFYTNALYPEGNYYEEDVIGHSIESDSTLFTLGGSYDSPEGWRVWGRAGIADLNRDGTVANPQLPTNFPNAKELGLVDVGATVPILKGKGELDLGVSYITDNFQSSQRARDQLGGSVRLRFDF